MKEEQVKTKQEKQAEAIVIDALEQIELKENEIANPPGADSPNANLTPSGFPRTFTAVENEESRIGRLENDISVIKADTITKVDDTVKELPENDQQRIKEGTAMVLYPQQDAQLSKDEFKQHKDMDPSQDFAMSVLAESYREKNLSKQPSAKSKDQTLRELNFPQFFQSLEAQQGYGAQKQQVSFAKDTHEITGRKIETPEQNKLSDSKETKAIEAPKSREEQFMERIGAGQEHYSDREQLRSDFEQNRKDVTGYDAQDIGEERERDFEPDFEPDLE
jgi:hypothetical protein